MNTKDFETVSRRDYEAALERAEKAERELVEVRRAAKSCIADAQTEKYMAIAELERERRAAAEMRAALERLKKDWTERHIGLLQKAAEASPDTISPDQLRAKSEVYGWVVADLAAALSSDAGKDYFHRDEFEPLADSALDKARQKGIIS